MHPVTSRPPVRLRGVTPGLYLQALFGGALNYLGWGLLELGMLAFWGMIVRCEAFTDWQFDARLSSATGIVTRVFDTGASEGEPGTPIFGIEYTFTPQGAASPRTGTSYKLGYPHPEVKDTVTVEYRPDRPAVSRIPGLRTAVFGAECLIALLFPLVGLGFVIFCLRKGWRTARLLARGTPAVGTLIRVERTMAEVNRRPVYRGIFTFTTAGGRRETAALAMHGLKPAWIALFRNTTPPPPPEDLQETVLYDPDNPAVACLPGELIPGLRIDDQGRVRNAGAAGSYAIVSFPAFVVVSNLLYMLHLLLK